MSPTSILLILGIFTVLIVFLGFRIIEALNRIAVRIGSTNAHLDELRTEVSAMGDVLTSSFMKMDSSQRDVVSSLEAVGEEIQDENFYSDSDAMYEKAKQLVVQEGKASASMLQRRLSIGYARAARLIDKLENEGVIGPQEGTRLRGVLQ